MKRGYGQISGGTTLVAVPSVGSARATAKAYRAAKRARRVPRPVRVYTRGSSETKYFDVGINVAITGAGTTWADTEVTADNYVTSGGVTGAYTDCCLIPTAQGSAYGQVIGQRYHLKKLRVRGNLSLAALAAQSAGVQAVHARILLVMDTQPNGAQAQGEDIMQDFGAQGENVFSFQRVASQTGRFRVLKDKFLTLTPWAFNDAATTGAVSYGVQNFKFQYKPGGAGLQVQIANGNSTPTVGATISHNIFMLCYASRNETPVALTVKACSRAYYQE